MTNYESGATTATGAVIGKQIRAVQSEHQAIIRDVLEAADFWGGTRSRVWKQFVADLGRNFQVIYDERNNFKMQAAAPVVESQLSAARQHSPTPTSALGQRRTASC
jgi:ESAT-6 family protein